MKKIIIENAKSIRYLEFNIPERIGIYLLVGANGAGKSTLLVCLDRICNNLAFFHGFYTARGVGDIDQYTSTSITYETDHSSIRYRKGPARWVATPRKESQSLLAQFGYNDSVFIKADSKRIEPTQAEIRHGTYTPAEPAVIEALNSIFETSRFTNLRRLRNTNGRGRQATYFYVVKNPDDTYSEKRFSSGELAIIRLVEELRSIPQESLLLVDEAEMALHPRIQKNLYNYIKEKAEEKNITVFISTHSTTLINLGSKDNIILLTTNEARTSEAIYPCYPAKAIGSVDYIDNAGFDYVLFVEDDMAKILLKKMVDKFLIGNPQHSTISVCIIPVGGYLETSKFAISTRQQLFIDTKVFAVLDADAFIEGQNNTQFWEVYQQNQSLVKNLNCTPELWIIDKLENCAYEIIVLLRAHFRIEIQSIITEDEYQRCVGDNPRKVAKKKLRVLINIIKSRTGENEILILDKLATLLVGNMTSGEIMQTVGPIMNSTRT